VLSGTKGKTVLVPTTFPELKTVIATRTSTHFANSLKFVRRIHTCSGFTFPRTQI
jgi:hypothetical protein